MSQTLNRKTIKKQKGKHKEDWWKEECRKKRAEVVKQLRKDKKNKGGNKMSYQVRREYRKLMNRKRIDARKRIVKEVAEDKTQKKLWKMVNRKIKKRQEVDEPITKEQWVDHFKEQLGGEDLQQEKVKKKRKEEAKRRSRRYKDGGGRKGNRKTEKKIKTSGPDRIQNEAWIYGKEEVKEELQMILNEIWKGGEFIGV